LACTTATTTGAFATWSTRGARHTAKLATTTATAAGAGGVRRTTATVTAKSATTTTIRQPAAIGRTTVATLCNVVIEGNVAEFNSAGIDKHRTAQPCTTTAGPASNTEPAIATFGFAMRKANICYFKTATTHKPNAPLILAGNR